MEKLLGKTLIKDNNISSTTNNVMKGKSLVLLYFSASGYAPCEAFTPILVKFYEKCCKSNRVEIVFVSSDPDSNSFNEYFRKMPWVSLPDNVNIATPQKLKESFGVDTIPTLVVLDAKTGHFVTGKAKADVLGLGLTLSTGAQCISEGNALIASWQSEVANRTKNINEKRTVRSVFTLILSKPMYIVTFVYMIQSAMELLNKNNLNEKKL